MLMNLPLRCCGTPLLPLLAWVAWGSRRWRGKSFAKPRRASRGASAGWNVATLAADSSADETVPAAIAVGLGLRQSRHDTLAALVEAVTPLEVLIALDSAEHVQSAVARVVEAVLQSAPRARFLVTSQIPLNAKGEQPLPTGTALPAFGASHGSRSDSPRCGGALRRARAGAGQAFRLERRKRGARGDIVPQPRRPSACHRTRSGTIRVARLRGLCAGLDQRLRLLTQSPEGAPARQQTLRASLEWSHGLLHTSEQKVLRRLAVFVGSASLETIKQVAADEAPDEWAVLDALGVLVDRSFVR